MYVENLRVKGTQKFMGKEIPVIEGGFGENKKVILAKTVAEIHGQPLKKINQLINENKEEFETGIDIIDLKSGYSVSTEFLQGIMNKQSIANSANIYLLSEQGYMALVQLMRTDKSKEIRKQLRREYFTMREMISSNEQTKARLLLTIYNGGQDSVLASKKLTEIEVKAATRPLLEKIDTQNTTIKEQEDAISEQEKKLRIQKPFVQAAMTLQKMEDTVSMEQASKLFSDDGIDIGRNNLMKLLREKGILMENNSPYQKYMDQGLFKVKIAKKETRYGVRMVPVTRVTGKGLIFLNKKLREWFDMEELDIDI